jgi:molybdopterin synthase catalytic subunit
VRVTVLAFAALRDRLGFSERTLELPEGATVASAAEALFGGRVPRGVAYAVNQSYTEAATRLEDGDELALLPPVSGGSDLPPLRVQGEPIDLGALLAAVRHPTCGAVLLFLGTAREVPGERLVSLEYEAYAPMAERFFRELADEIRRKHGVERVAIVHRTGTIALGEVSVAIALASAHRAPGLDALRHAIDAIKERAPVWKREVMERGGRWVAVEKLEGG